MTFLLALPSGAAADDDQALFQKGLAQYQAKQYAEAAASFQEILAHGLVNAQVLHDAALANYQKGDKALALALWRKALTLSPAFSPARAGRSFAEGELQQRGFERDGLAQSLQDLLEFISLRESLWLIALVLGAGGWLWIRYLAERRAAFDEERPLPPFPTAATALAALLVLCVALSALKARSAWRTRATVLPSSVSARSLPADDAVGLFDLRGGAEVLVRRQEKDWAQIQNSEGVSGWLKNSEIFVTSGR